MLNRKAGLDLERINRILQHPTFTDCLAKIEACELERLFCRHDLTHLLDVARIGVLLALTQQDWRSFVKEMGVKQSVECQDAAAISYLQEIIYAAALLHDLGKWKQYREGADHAVVGAELCRPILQECGYAECEIVVIQEAIRQHRKKGKDMARDFLGRTLAQADLYSRNCFACSVADRCHHAERKNKKLFF